MNPYSSKKEEQTKQQSHLLRFKLIFNICFSVSWMKPAARKLQRQLTYAENNFVDSFALVARTLLMPHCCFTNLFFSDELDSFMYQTVGHDVINLYSEAIGLPLFRRTIAGSSVCQKLNYESSNEDEVEDLLLLLKRIQVQYLMSGLQTVKFWGKIRENNS